MGNRELMFFPEEGEKNFCSRFPVAPRTGHVRTIDSIAVVLLISNFDHLTLQEALAQRHWYMHILDTLDVDRSIRAAIVCCHHAPYSNSMDVGVAKGVQEQFVTPFVASRKRQLFLSGHAHAFEHFQRSK
jgi:hypothetical protein